MRQILVIWILYSLLLSVSLFSNGTEVFSPYRGFSQEDEVVIARSENTKLFRRKNGNFVWRIFLHPIHKLNENEQLIDIDPFPAQPLWEDPLSDYAGTADYFWDDIYTTWIHINDGIWECRGFARFNTSGIPDGSTIDTVKLTLHCRANYLSMFDHDIWSMENKPLGNCGSIYFDAYNGYRYVDDFCPYEDTWYTWILGDDQDDYACQQMMNLLPDDWFAVGLSESENYAWSGTIEYYSSGGYLELPEPTAVALVSFTASPDIDYVQLKWRTEYEVDNLQWLIERKEEHGDNYEVIGTLPGQHTKPGPTNYAFTDFAIMTGKAYYYRLIDISTHGYQSIHNPLFVQIPTCIGEQLLISPTIFSNELTMHIRGVHGKSGMLFILDEAGRVVKEISISGRNSPLAITWNGTDTSGRRLSNGVYFIRLAINGNKSETKKVILIK